MQRFFRDQVAFFEQAVRAARQVGAFSPTSRPVAEAMARLVLPRTAGAPPRRVLEVGAGMGAITRALVPRLGSDDQLDLSEINPAFAAHLRERFGEDERVGVIEGDVAELHGEPYQAIVASLPLLNMDPASVELVFARMLGPLLEPGGVVVYYDYWAKEVRRFLPASPRERRRVRDAIRVTRAWRERYEVRREVLLRNFPPAHLHVLRKPRG